MKLLENGFPRQYIVRIGTQSAGVIYQVDGHWYHNTGCVDCQGHDTPEEAAHIMANDPENYTLNAARILAESNEGARSFLATITGVHS